VVRFKVNSIDGKLFLSSLFQFQSGAIQSDKLTHGSFIASLFQFQSGAIQRLFAVIRFDGANVFQFQSGAIQSKTYKNDVSEFFCFNSKVVRFKGNLEI